jgi:hypothetical protein
LDSIFTDSSIEGFYGGGQYVSYLTSLVPLFWQERAKKRKSPEKIGALKHP